MRKDIWRSLRFWVSRTQPSTSYNVFEKASAHLVEGSTDDDLEDTAKVHDDFDEMVDFQAWLYTWNKRGLKTVSSVH